MIKTKKRKINIALLSTVLSCALIMCPSVKAKAQSYRFPLLTKKASVTSSYGWRTHPIYGTRRFHAGVDLVCSNKYIIATKSGRIIQSGYDSSRGNYLILKHSDNAYHSIYMHLSKKYVSLNERVTQGQIIAYMGTTGASTGTHLHFQLEKPPSYSTVNVNPSSLSYKYSTSHTHVYTYKTTYSATHPHQAYGQCVCGEKKAISGKYSVHDDCSKCSPNMLNSSKTYIKGKDSTTFKWDKVNHADEYTYYLYQVAGSYARTYPTRTGTTSSTSVTLKDLPVGKYNFFVEAKNDTSKLKSDRSDIVYTYLDESKYTPKKAVLHNGKIYALFNTSTTWTYAKTICSNLGGNLVSISSSSENNIVTDLTKKYGSRDYYYIGLSDKEKEKTYKWVDGTKYSYSKWAKNQPSHSNASKEYLRQAYVALDKSNGYAWNDITDLNNDSKYKSTSNRGFILEINSPDPPLAPKITKVSQSGHNKAIIHFEKSSGANKYSIYMATSLKGTYTKLGETSSLSYTAKDLTIGRTYYFKIIPYASKYGIDIKGKTSDIKSLKISPLKVNNLKIKNGSKTNVYITYNNVTSVDGYRIYRSSSKNGTYKRIKTTTDASYTDHIKKKKKRIIYYKVRAYVKRGNTYYYGPYSDIKYIKYK